MLDLMGELGSVPSSPQTFAGQGSGQVASLDFDRLLLKAQKERTSVDLERPEAKRRRMDDTTVDEAEERIGVVRDEERAATEAQEAGKEAENDTRAAENFEPFAYLGEVMEEVTGLAPAVEVPVESTTETESTGSGKLLWAEATDEIQGTEPTGEEGGETEMEMADESIAQSLVPGEEGGGETEQSLGLLSFDEMMDPELVVEKAPEQLLARLQQAVGAGSAPVIEEAAETVLPQVLRGLATLVRNGTAEMRLQLQPADLGEIELRVRTTEATVGGQMMVQHSEVKQLLDSHMDRLRAALAEQGLELEGFDVNVERDAHFGQADESWRGPDRGESGIPQGRPGDEAIAVGSNPQRVATGDHEVDYTI